MSRVLRRLTLVLALGLAACAAHKLSTTPSATYGVVEETKLTEDEALLLAQLKKAAGKSKIQVELLPDNGLSQVARGIVNRSITLDKEEATVEVHGGGGAVAPTGAGGGAPVAASKTRTKKHAFMRDNLFEAGISDATYNRKSITKGYNDGLPEAEELEDLFVGVHPVQGKLYVGVASVTDGVNSARHYGFVVVQRTVAFTGLPRRAEPSAHLPVTGTFFAPPTHPTLWLQKADGTVEGRNLNVAADGKFSETFELPAQPGQYTLEITDAVGGRQDTMAAAVVGVGEVIAHWPPAQDDEVNPTNGAELAKAINAAIAQAHGGEFQGRADVLEAAKTCSEALAAGGTCNANVTGWNRIMGDDAVKLEDAELWVAELKALPSVRAILSDKRVNAFGVSAAPLKDKKGEYAVALVFAGEAGPAAK